MKLIIVACIFFSFCAGFFLCALFMSAKIAELERRNRYLSRRLGR